MRVEVVCVSCGSNVDSSGIGGSSGGVGRSCKLEGKKIEEQKCNGCTWEQTAKKTKKTGKNAGNDNADDYDNVADDNV